MEWGILYGRVVLSLLRRVPAGFTCSKGDSGCCHRGTGLRAGHIPPALLYGASIVTQGAQPFCTLSGWMDAKFKCSFSCK